MEWHYTQPKEHLDLAWDLYMDLSLLDAPEGAPDLLDLDPPTISRLFDIAITAWRSHAEEEEDDG